MTPLHWVSRRAAPRHCRHAHCRHRGPADDLYQRQVRTRTARIARLGAIALSVPSHIMPSAASSRSTWLNSPPSALMPGPEPGDGGMIRITARRRSPGSPRPARTASRSPGWIARPGSTRTAAARPSSPGRTPRARAHRPGTGGGTRPDPGLPPLQHDEHQIVLGQPLAHAPPASATADHAADKRKFCGTHHDPRHRGCPYGGAPFMRQAELCTRKRLLPPGRRPRYWSQYVLPGPEFLGTKTWPRLA